MVLDEPSKLYKKFYEAKTENVNLRQTIAIQDTRIQEQDTRIQEQDTRIQDLERRLAGDIAKAVRGVAVIHADETSMGPSSSKV